MPEDREKMYISKRTERKAENYESLKEENEKRVERLGTWSSKGNGTTL